MIVVTPNTFEVHFTTEEVETITNCLQILQNVSTTLAKHNSTILEWEDGGSQVTKESIDDMIYDLDVLTNVDVMFQGEPLAILGRPTARAHNYSHK